MGSIGFGDTRGVRFAAALAAGLLMQGVSLHMAKAQMGAGMQEDGVTDSVLGAPSDDAPETAPGDATRGAADGAGDTAEAGADADATEAEPPPPIVVSEAEARTCAARLEPMLASYEDPTEAMYLRRMGETGIQVWAPRAARPGAPMHPWCVTTLAAIAGVPFLSVDARALVMELVAAAGDAPPPQPDAPPAEETAPPPAPEVVVEGEEEEEPRGLPAAYQRVPPKGGRSAPQIGLPVPVTAALPLAARVEADACVSEGGQPTAVVDRFSGRMLGGACWLADGTARTLPALADHLGAN
ncbi:hypothetical protein F1188_06385 [Roseospira marina]|uniref:Uncharacterized protein n=1 Tax=Roseospira marina TaxID=140057 RepID=A0A5M6IFY3_9PROT|nr:hypothetical protein [Roseospira marina]KAA5606488.1 hypothetical protein F1188_06385 [Roseospira marina]MBB4314091.1 hypothetical protein [Roseospira marina]MBB5087252.1 hypothetical protein [Roseospira marina]